MTESLFDSIERKPLSFENLLDSSFQYLNRYEWPAGERLRENFEAWFTRYPCEDQEELRARFRSSNSRTHEGAFFELFLHELFIQLGYKITVHPTISGVSTRPDYFVSYGDRNFVLEATTVGQKSGPFTRNRNEQDVIDKLNTLTSQHFYIGVHMEGELSKTQGRKDVIPPFQELLDSHDPDEVQSLIDRRDMYEAPFETIEHESWKLTGWLLPIDPDNRKIGVKRQQIVIEPYRATWTNSVTPAQKTLKGKAKKYGQLDRPYVVALNARDLFYNGRANDLDVLFGKQQLWYFQDHPDLPPKPSRGADGIWPHCNQIDAVLMCQKADVWNLQNVSACLYVNPFGDRDPGLPENIFRLPHAKGCNGEMQWFEGEDIALG